MDNKQYIYRTTFTSCIVLIAMLMCCIALIGCPETEMVDDVVLPPGHTDPNVNPNVDPNLDPNVDPNLDPNVDPN